MNSTTLTVPSVDLSSTALDARADVQAHSRADATDYQPLSRTELLLILGFWTLIAIMTSANALIEPRGHGPWQPLVPFAATLVNFANAFMWCAVTPAIIWFASRFAIERTRWPTRVMFVVIGLVLAIIIDLATSFVRQHLFYSPTPISPDMAAMARLRRLWFMNEFIVFVAVLAGGFARNYFWRYQVRREETVRLQAQAAQLQAQLADARLSALRMQLNPHFLFNTLHAVSALVERDPRGVRRMIARLSELLRTSLDEADEQEVPLQRELTFTERYLDVIQIRFQGHLHVDMHADDDVRDALVPNLILQPLVENAVKHGISKLSSGGHIEVTAAREGERVILSVRDNGPEVPLDTLPAPNSLGLRNTRARLAALYGPDQSLTLKHAHGGGLIAEVSLPYHTGNDLRTSAVAASA
ncbi:MAG TPA: histidine kinase [Steroidobacteraceae bacterium]|nr:histidine kinase [Steroidobacteraceae bacterium]